MRAALALVLLAAPAVAADGVALCGARLEAVKSAMEVRAPLKEEHATALMWMQLDAEAALAAGNAEACERTLVQMEQLLPADQAARTLPQQSPPAPRAGAAPPHR